MEIVCIDVNSKNEVWKARLKASSSIGPVVVAKKSARKLINKLKEDKIL